MSIDVKEFLCDLFGAAQETPEEDLLTMLDEL